MVSIQCIAQMLVTQTLKGLRDLRSLTINAPLSNYTCLTHILDACPNLTFLSITVPCYVKLGNILSCKNAHKYTNLVSFCLKAPGRYLSLMPLLSRCPSLRRLELHVQTFPRLDKDTILRTCQDLEYLCVASYFVDPLQPASYIQWPDPNGPNAIEVATNQLSKLRLCK